MLAVLLFLSGFFDLCIVRIQDICFVSLWDIMNPCEQKSKKKTICARAF